MPLVDAVHTPCSMPADFDQPSYGRFGKLALGFLSEDLRLNCGSGLNGVAFRFVGADEAHERFSGAIGGTDAFHPAGPRYAQEEALFAFVLNACSTVLPRRLADGFASQLDDGHQRG